MTVLQPIHKSGPRSSALARRLINSTTLAKHVRETMVEFQHQPGHSVSVLEAKKDRVIAGITLLQGQHYFLVASNKFPAFSYVVCRRNGEWICSSQNECIAQGSIQAAKLFWQRVTAGRFIA